MRMMGKQIPNWSIPLVITAVVLFAVGFIAGGGRQGSGKHGHGTAEDTSETPTSWTCSMHPQIQQPALGLCPLCGMDLIPAGSGGSGSPRELSLSPAAVKLAGVITAPVERKQVSVELRLAGKVTLDETRVASISAWFPGRIDSLYIDFTGVSVEPGDPLALLYSSQLLTAQEELIQALSAKQAANGSASASFTQSIGANVDAARSKLKRFGLTAQQISTIEQSKNATDQLTIHAPIGGIVTQKQAITGIYVGTGSQIYTIADLSHVWIELEAYEADLGWLRIGQTVQVEALAYPGRLFTGLIEFIDPILNDRTRTVAVRVDVPNDDLSLKPGMLVDGLVTAIVDASGRAVADTTGLRHPLTIPATAPLLTGKRAVVYLADGETVGKFTGREIQLGPRAGDDFVVLDGLSEGEEVVAQGSFKIDSAIQITAGYSMMNPAKSGSEAQQIPHHGLTPPDEPFVVNPDFISQLSGLYGLYFKLQTALSLDQTTESAKAAASLAKAIGEMPALALSSDADFYWRQLKEYLGAYATSISTANDLAMARELFEPVSKATLLLVEGFGSSAKKPIIKFHCPMAFDWRGAGWLQDHQGVENPYFGSEMFSCGSELNTLYQGEQKND